MSLAEIKHAIEELPEGERVALADWLWKVDQRAWDTELIQDFSPGGPGQKLLKEVDAAIDPGDFKPLE